MSFPVLSAACLWMQTRTVEHLKKSLTPVSRNRYTQIQRKLQNLIPLLDRPGVKAADLMPFNRFLGFVALSYVRLPRDYKKIPALHKELAKLDLEGLELSAHGVFESNAVSAEDFQ